MKASTLARPALLCLLGLAGCFAEVEDESVVIERVLPICDDGTASCAFQGIPGFRAEPLPLAVDTGQVESTLHLGDADLFQRERELGPFDLKGHLVIRRAVVTSITPGVTLAGIEHLELQQLPSRCGTDCPVTTLATYDRPAAGGDDVSLVLAGTGANLLDLLRGGELTIRILASGALPSTYWQARLRLEGSIHARGAL